MIADITGWQIRRRVRQHDGDSDLEGVPGWSVEVKRHASAGPAARVAWWQQSVAQAGDELRPVVFYRLDRHPWRALWSLEELALGRRGTDYTYVAETSIEAWCAVAREQT